MSKLVGREEEGGGPVQSWYEPAVPVYRRSEWGSSGGGSVGSDLTRFRDAVRLRLWLVAVGFVPVFGLALLYTIMAPREYESESTFLLQESDSDKAGSSLELFERLGRVGRIENEVELLKSRRVVAPTVDALDLHVGAEVDGKSVRPGRVLQGFSASRSAVEGSYLIRTTSENLTQVVDAESDAVLAEASAGDTVRLAGISFVAAPAPSPDVALSVSSFDRGVQQVLGMVSASRVGREADLIRLTCTAPEPLLAQQICEDISNSYLQLRGELQTTEATNAREFLTDAAEQIRGRLTSAEDSLASYARQYGAVALNIRAEEEIRSLAQLRAQRELLEADRDALAAYLNQVESGSGTGSRYRDLANFPTFLQNMAVTELVSSLVELDNSRSELAVLRSPENPELAAINERIGEIELQLLSLASSYKEALDSQIRSYDETLSRGADRLAALPQQQVEYVRRERKVQQLQQVYGMLEGQLREAELVEGVSMPGIRPIDAPQYPLAPSAPSVKLNLLLGALLGLGFGTFLALLREFTDDRLRDREQVELAAGAPVIAMLPSVRSRSKDPEWQPAIEAFRTLAADLKISTASHNGDPAPRSIAVTSSAQGEGKTFTSCNLAMIWASKGSKTLLVDADLRAVSVARYFKMPKGLPGFGDLLQGTVRLEDAVQEVPVRGGHVLHVLPAGSVTIEEGAEALHLPGRFADTFEELESAYEFVFIDTPPLNIVSDSTIMAAAADAVLFVVRSGITRPDSLDLALQRLRRVNRDLVGLVLNDVKLPAYYTSYYGVDRNQ